MTKTISVKSIFTPMFVDIVSDASRAYQLGGRGGMDDNYIGKACMRADNKIAERYGNIYGWPTLKTIQTRIHRAIDAIYNHYFQVGYGYDHINGNDNWKKLQNVIKDKGQSAQAGKIVDKEMKKWEDYFKIDLR